MIATTLSALISGKKLHSVAPSATLADACDTLARHNVGALAVCDGGRLEGILSERDVIRRGMAGGMDPAQLRVNTVMRRSPVLVDEGAAPTEALALMKQHGVRHLIVTRGLEPVGMVSMRDIPSDSRELWESYESVRAIRPLPETVQPYV